MGEWVGGGGGGEMVDVPFNAASMITERASASSTREKRTACFRGRRGFLHMTAVSRAATPFLAVDCDKKTTFRRENQ